MVDVAACRLALFGCPIPIDGFDCFLCLSTFPFPNVDLHLNSEKQSKTLQCHVAAAAVAFWPGISPRAQSGKVSRPC